MVYIPGRGRALTTALLLAQRHTKKASDQETLFHRQFHPTILRVFKGPKSKRNSSQISQFGPTSFVPLSSSLRGKGRASRRCTVSSADWAVLTCSPRWVQPVPPGHILETHTQVHLFHNNFFFQLNDFPGFPSHSSFICLVWSLFFKFNLSKSRLLKRYQENVIKVDVLFWKKAFHGSSSNLSCM